MTLAIFEMLPVHLVVPVCRNFAQISRPLFLKAVGVYFSGLFVRDSSKCSLVDLEFGSESERDRLLAEMASAGDAFPAAWLPHLRHDRPADRLRDMIGGTGSFANLSVAARERIVVSQIKDGLFSLSMFLSRFGHHFDSLSTILSNFGDSIVAQAGAKVMLGIDSAHMTDAARGKLLTRLCEVYPQEESIVRQICALNKHLSPASSMSHIAGIHNDCQSWVVKRVLKGAIQESSELITANDCMRALKRPHLEKISDGKQPVLLFDKRFLEKHEISREQQLSLLQNGTIESYFFYLHRLANVDHIDGQLLASLVQQPELEEWSQTCIDNILLLCRFDDSVLEGFSVALDNVPAATIIQMVLGTGASSHLDTNKRSKVLRRLGLDVYADMLGRHWEGDRRGLLHSFFSAIFERFKKQMVDLLDEPDYQLLLESVLQDPELHRHLPQFYARPVLMAVCIAKHVGSDVRLLESFKLPAEILSELFLLTEHEAVAEHIRPNVGAASTSNVEKSNLPRALVLRALRRSQTLTAPLEEQDVDLEMNQDVDLETNQDVDLEAEQDVDLEQEDALETDSTEDLENGDEGEGADGEADNNDLELTEPEVIQCLHSRAKTEEPIMGVRRRLFF